MAALLPVKDALKQHGGAYFNKKRFEDDINYVLKMIDKIERHTNLESADMLEALGGKAARFASTYTNPRVRPAKFRNKQPNKLFRRKVVTQGKKTEGKIKGVWYERVGKSTVKKRKGRKRSKPNAKLQQFNKKTRGKSRANKSAPFLSPAPIPKAKARGLRKAKMVVYLQGNRRRGKFGMLPVNMDKGWNQKVLRKRNPGAAMLGWRRAIGQMKRIDPKDNQFIAKKNPTSHHRSIRKKVRIGRKAPSMRKGAALAIINRVKYAGTSKANARGGARKGTRSAINWFMKFHVKKELKMRYKRYNKIYRRVTA